jgi:cell division protein DivIC
MNKLAQFRLSSLPPVFRNFYLITGLVFLVWMLFFDANDLVSQWRKSRKLGELEAEKEYYQQKIVEVTAEREELKSNPQLLEKFARENYLMKRPTETVYIVVNKPVEK